MPNVHNFYLHGLELRGMDLTAVLKKDWEDISSRAEGFVEDCKVIYDNGYTLNVKVYAWIPNDYEHTIRGLIVEPGTDFEKQAKDFYSRRVESC